MGARAKVLLGICGAGVLSFFGFVASDVLHEGDDPGFAKPTSHVRRLLPQASRYLESRWTNGEGWQLFCAVRYLGDSPKGARIDVYVWEACQSYRARDDRLADFTGWSVPAVITFRRTRTGFQVVDERQADDGDYYWPSIRRMFPTRAVQEIQRMDGEIGTGSGSKAAMFADLKRRARRQLLDR
jgi:hypothetical protein